MYTYDGKILTPKKVTSEYSVVACDQYTSEPEYWEEIAKKTQGKISTYHMVFPEAYLSEDNTARIKTIESEMHKAISEDFFGEFEGITFIERKLPNGKIRSGLCLLIDLEEYSFNPQDKAVIRATEGTIIQRIPPRVKIRENAPLEFPHVMLLFDDAKDSVMNMAREIKGEILYQTDLIGGGGSITGYKIQNTKCMHAEIAKCAKVADESTLMFAVGDGNHSLATAKACYENKKNSGEDASLARYALCEIVNIYDNSLQFEPIHRVMLGADSEKFIAGLKNFEGEDFFTVLYGGEEIKISVSSDVGKAYKAVQDYIDNFILENGGEVDYIHGEDSLRKITAREEGAVGLLLKPINKDTFFEEILANGNYPRKTFSMGEAYEKRYYFEGRRI
ncbi:MAG: DUF1015 domain-containing protein [Bacillota bacterium]